MNSTTNAPYPIANVMDKFGSYFTEHLRPDQRGQPDVFVALVMTEDHGWSESPSWSSDITTWNFANLAANRNVRFLHEIFRDVFYPGSGDLFSYFAFPFGHVRENENPPPSPFARSSITSRYAPSSDDVYVANSNLLDIGRFENRDDAKTWFQTSDSNPSTYVKFENVTRCCPFITSKPVQITDTDPWQIQHTVMSWTYLWEVKIAMNI